MSMQEECFHLGTKVFLYEPKGKVLLLQKPEKNGRSDWDLPGGRMQKGEPLLQTLHREVEEETGFILLERASAFDMVLTNIRIPTAMGEVGLILSLFLCPVRARFEPLLSREHCGFGWFEFSEAALLLKPQYPPAFLKKLEAVSKNLSIADNRPA